MLTANRIAALAAFLIGLAGLVAPLAGAFEGTGLGRALVAVAGLLTALGTVLKFLQGSQEWDKLTAPAPEGLPLLDEGPVEPLSDEEKEADRA